MAKLLLSWLAQRRVLIKDLADWQGEVSQVITALEARVTQLGPATTGEPANSLRQIVAQTRGYHMALIFRGIAGTPVPQGRHVEPCATIEGAE